VCLLARLWGSSVGSFHELIVRLQRRAPLDHPPFATLTIMATAVSNGQLGITHAVARSAMRTTKVKLRGGRRAAHNYILHVVSKKQKPRANEASEQRATRELGGWGCGRLSKC
jgi:hypothetical protein